MNASHRRYLFAILAVSLFSFSLQAQEDLAERMENAMATLKAAGADEPQAIALMLNSAAEGYIQRGDFETALERIRESLRLCLEHDIDPASPFITASRILGHADEDEATEFLVGQLQTKGASPKYKKG
ncbi:MAG: hypothetical protein AAGF67_12530, partial [Verrucomicrobiota bacterium]